jgi:hypothetical protein
MKKILHLFLIFTAFSTLWSCNDNESSPSSETSLDSVKMYYTFTEIFGSRLVKNEDTITTYVGDTVFIKTKHKNLYNYNFAYSNDILKIDAKGDSAYVCIPQSIGMGYIVASASDGVSAARSMVNCHLQVMPKTFDLFVTSAPTYTISANNDSIKQLINNELNNYALKKWRDILLTYNTIWGGNFSFVLLTGDSISGKFGSSIFDKKEMTMGYNNTTYECLFSRNADDTKIDYRYTVEQNLTDLFKAKYPNKVDSVAIFTKVDFYDNNFLAE